MATLTTLYRLDHRMCGWAQVDSLAIIFEPPLSLAIPRFPRLPHFLFWANFFYVPMSSVVSHTILVFFHSFPIVCKNTLSWSTIWWGTVIGTPARSRQSLLTTLPSWVNAHNQVPTHSPPHSQPQLSKGLVGCEQKLTMLVADKSRAWQVCNCLHILVVHSC